MIKRFHEAPKSIFNRMQYYTDGDYALVHLFETDEEYLNMFKKAVAEKDTAKKAKAFEVLRDTAGQKPVDKVEQTNTNITIDFSDIEE